MVRNKLNTCILYKISILTVSTTVNNRLANG